MAYNNRGFGDRQGGGKKGYSGDYDYQKGQLPKGYLSGGYYETVGGEKALRPEYIVEHSKEIADKLSKREEWDGKSPQNKRSQIRKFYEYVLGIQELLQRKNNNFQVVEAELQRLIPFVNYARSRGTVSELFENFIEKNIRAVHNPEDLKALAKHFESIVAYLPKEKN
jgi:CRISPR-associated protein Csm2